MSESHDVLYTLLVANDPRNRAVLSDFQQQMVVPYQAVLKEHTKAAAKQVEITAKAAKDSVAETKKKVDDTLKAEDILFKESEKMRKADFASVMKSLDAEEKARKKAFADQEKVAKQSAATIKASHAQLKSSFEQVATGIGHIARAAVLFGVAEEESVEKAMKSLAKFQAGMDAIKGTWAIIDGGVKAWQAYTAAAKAAAAANVAVAATQALSSATGGAKGGGGVGGAVGGIGGALASSPLGLKVALVAGTAYAGFKGGQYIRGKLDGSTYANEQADAAEAAANKQAQRVAEGQARAQAAHDQDLRRTNTYLDEATNSADTSGRIAGLKAGKGLSGDDKALASNAAILEEQKKAYQTIEELGNDAYATDVSRARIWQQQEETAKKINDLEKNSAEIQLNAAKESLDAAKQQLDLTKQARAGAEGRIWNASEQIGKMDPIERARLLEERRKIDASGDFSSVSQQDLEKLGNLDSKFAKKVQQHHQSEGYSASKVLAAGEHEDQEQLADEQTDDQTFVDKKQELVKQKEKAFDEVSAAFDDLIVRLLEKMKQSADQAPNVRAFAQ